MKGKDFSIAGASPKGILAGLPKANPPRIKGFFVAPLKGSLEDPSI